MRSTRESQNKNIPEYSLVNSPEYNVISFHTVLIRILAEYRAEKS